MTTVNIGDKVLTIMSDTVDLVMEKYFNVVPEESEIEEAEAGAVEAVLPALPSEDAMAGEMETESSGQATEMPAPDCSEGGGDEDTGAEEGSVQEPGARQQQRRSECGTQVQCLS